ncbi:MAG TPA: hypothetical protein VNF68_00750 [Candidatus Baltobacteraceae bacterium]|nr:hypothetical protein [Candidatus Baltobacteraceae bacterium]
MIRLKLASTLLVAFALAGCGGGSSGAGGGTTYSPSTAAPTPTPTPGTTTPASMPQQGTVGTAAVYVGQNGHTLYLFNADTTGVSNCSSASGCTGVWPPYAAPAGTTAPSGTSFGIMTRTDGTLQWTFAGLPLYEYSGDSAAGQGNGQNITSFGGTWAMAQPASPGVAPTPWASKR